MGRAGFGGRWGGAPVGVRALVVARVRGGEVVSIVAGDVGVSQRTVFRWMAEAGGMPIEWTGRGERRLSPCEREEIRVGLAGGESFRVIAGRLGRATSTVSREVNANGGRGGYRAVAAERRAERQARRPKVAKLVRCERLRAWVEAALVQRWSPQQISARLVEEFPDDEEMRVSHETIYQSLFVQSRGALRKELTAYLRSNAPSVAPSPAPRRRSAASCATWSTSLNARPRPTIERCPATGKAT